jgi:hypothetical protein
VERLDAVDRMMRYCGNPSPGWLRAMIIKLYKQMKEIRVHAEKKFRKILRPKSDFSPTIQLWYNHIHAYLQLIRLKEGKQEMREAATFCNLLVGSTSSTPKLSQWTNLRTDFSLHAYAGRVEETGKKAPQGPPAQLPD